ncbi:hypothetical protein [Gemmatimonas aurantiaca]|uniref:hypothetical protein n=1 Tax=Gemmatimonas aurantiaca TaxID=173480 RepID=UPI00301DA113
MENVELYKRVRNALDSGQSLDQVVALLRDAGCSKGQSFIALTDATSMDMAAATAAVNESQTWRDQRAQDESLNAAFWSTMSQQGELQSDGSVDITEWLNSGTDSER